mgnify:CR=1 FL=1
MTDWKRLASGLALALAATACATGPDATIGQSSDEMSKMEDGKAVAHPEIWPAYEYPIVLPQSDTAMVADFVSRMTLEEKIGQLVQADLCCVTPEDAKTYNLGSILVGGNSGPNGNDLSPAPDWLAENALYLGLGIGLGVPLLCCCLVRSP